MQFDGADDYVNVDDNSILDFGAGTNFTAMAWVRISDKTSVGSTFISKVQEEGAPSDGGWYLVYNKSINKIQFDLTSDTWNFYCEVRASTDMKNGRWYHVAVVVNRAASGSGIQVMLAGNDGFATH
jgi:hypothetical protein